MERWRFPTMSWRGGRGFLWIAWALGVLAMVSGAPESEAGTQASGTEAGRWIRWRCGAAEVIPKDPAQIRDALTALMATPDERHLVVQFDAPVDPKLRAKLQSAGLRLLDYLGSHAFFASISQTDVDAMTLSSMASLIDVKPIEPKWRLHPYLLAGNVPPWAVVSPVDPFGNTDRPVVGAYVMFHPDVPLLPTGVDVALQHGASIRSMLEAVNGLVIELPFDSIFSLAEEDVVQWIEPPLPRMEELNDSNRAATGADTAQAPPYNLDGSGVTVLVYDGGYALASHADFGGRLTVRDSSGLSDHATHVAGTIGGDGTLSGGQYRGMAPAVIMESYGFDYDGSGIFLYSNPGDIEDDYDEAINVYGVDISNNSIGTNTCWNGFPCEITGDYGVTSVLIDSIVAGSLGEPFRVVWANGNERSCPSCPGEHEDGYHSTAPPACAKNHLTVGALNSNNDTMTSFSSWGPCDDGRLKPDVSGPGCQSDDDFAVTSCSSSGGYTTKCGTSMSSPTVCGLGALLLEDYRDHYPGEPDFRNSMLRALFAHTAVDLGNAGPDYAYGYGSVRVVPAIELMRAGNFLEAEVDQGDVYSVIVVVDTGEELKVTLAWDDEPGTPNVDPALVNDLDLVVYDPSSVQHLPWTLDPADPGAPAVQTQADHVDNIEQVYVASAAPGVWRVEVHGFNVPLGPQPFSLTASPLLLRCSTIGSVSLDRPKYMCESEANIRVVDCDLDTDDAVIEEVEVTIASDTEPAGETVLLTETGPSTAAFDGAVTLSVMDAPGILHVSEGDTVTATYIDEDDGFGGFNIPREATAIVDCQAPVIANVQIPSVGPYDATVTYAVNEPALGSVWYGTACGALADVAVGVGYQTSHIVHLAGLSKETTYFFAVEAEDEAENTTFDDNEGACYTFTTPEAPDSFTEAFVGDFDLPNKTLTFVPDGSISLYGVCMEEATEFPTDPMGGTALALWDDDYLAVVPSSHVWLYGTSYDTFYVGSNGYVTFTAGDDMPNATLQHHFSLPRISALFADLDPRGGSEWCPGEGDCCVAHPTPGCENVVCCETVCAVDEFCCLVEWDQLCADHAFDLCGSLCTDLSSSPHHSSAVRTHRAAAQLSPTISWKQLGDRVAVTYEDVPEYGTSNSNNFQIEMFFDGMIRITWLAIDTVSGICGLSEGNGVPVDYMESDLGEYDPCDCLVITPHQGLSSSGYEGGPFTPQCMTYTLTNNCDSPLDWTAAGTQAWSDVTPGSGTLSPFDTATVDVCINANANSLPPDTYNDMIELTNTTSGLSRSRGVILEVLAIPGEIDVADSIADPHDLDMPFGDLIVGLSRTEHITVANTDAVYNLLVTAISLQGPQSSAADFSLQNLPALPVTVPPLGFFDFDVVYAPGSVGPHENSVLIESNDPDEGEVMVTLSGTGVPDYLVVTPPDDFESVGEEGGPFTPRCKTYTLTNGGSVTLDWTAAGMEIWLDIAPSSGTLAVSDFTTVDVCINANADLLAPGLYSDTVTFANQTTGILHTRGVELTVWEPCSLPSEPDNPSPPDEASDVVVDTHLRWGEDYPGDKIQRANLDGTNVEYLVTAGMARPFAVALDLEARKMYWVDEGTHDIKRANLDGSAVRQIVATGLSNPAGIALDVPGGKMYWTDLGTDKIQRANLDGSDIEDLVTEGLAGLRGIALDIPGGKMYWADAATDKIQRANLDGSDVEDFLTSPGPWGIALDLDAGKLYWTDFISDAIRRVNLDGTNIEDLITDGLIAPHGIALDQTAGKMYWADGGDFLEPFPKIQRANLDGSNVETLFTTGLSSAEGIALDLDEGKIYWVDLNTAATDRTDTTLSTSISTPRRSFGEHVIGGGITLGARQVACPTTYDVYFGIANPPTTLICEDISGAGCDPGALDLATTYYWQVVARNSVGETPGPVWMFTTESCDPAPPPVNPTPFDGTTDVLLDADLAWNATQKMYWVDMGTDKVQRANLDGSEVEDLVTTGLDYPEGIAIDSVAGWMYWTDWGTDNIRRANLDGSDVQEIVDGLVGPQGIALDFTAEKIYWTDSGSDKIQRANMDGTGVQDLVTQGLGEPRGIALDVAADKMYWTHFPPRIQRANLDGSNVETLLTDLDSPSGPALDLTTGKMYWTDASPGTIERANFDGSEIEVLVTNGLNRPWGIALDVGAGKVYWTDPAADRIQRANLDGTDVEDLVLGLSSPRGIALGFQTALFTNGQEAIRQPEAQRGALCPVTYDVFFDTVDPPPTLICEDISDTWCDPGALDFVTTYFWQVVAKSPGTETPGPIWSFTTTCPQSDPPQPEEPTVIPKNRYMSFVPGDPGHVVALQVTFTSLPGYEYAEGRTMWVQDPYAVTEASGSDGPTPPPVFWAAELGCEPHYAERDTVGVVDVFNEAIVPGAVFDIRAIDEACNVANPRNYSSALTVLTSEAGDVVGSCDVCPCTGPNGVVDFVDSSAVVEKFKNVLCVEGAAPGVPRKARADLVNSDVTQPLPDRKVDFVDISCVVDAFCGDPRSLPGPPANDPCTGL